MALALSQSYCHVVEFQSSEFDLESGWHCQVNETETC